DPGVVRDAGETGRARVVERLEPRVLGECPPGFFGFDNRRELGECDQLELTAGSRKNVEDLADFPFVGGRDDQLHARTDPTTLRCSVTRSRMPLSPSAIRSSSASRSKGGPSAVPWISIKRP